MIFKVKMLKGACIYVAGKQWYIPDSEATKVFQEIIRFIDKRAAIAVAEVKEKQDEQE